MPSKHQQTVCPNCRARNKLSKTAPQNDALCQQCGRQLFRPVVQKLTDEDFPALLKGEDVPVLIDFWAPWCQPCKRIAPIFEQLCKRTPNVRFGKINIDDYPKVAQKSKVQSIPLLVLYRRGKEVSRLTGLQNQKKIQHWLNQHLSR